MLRWCRLSSQLSEHILGRRLLRLLFVPGLVVLGLVVLGLVVLGLVVLGLVVLGLVVLGLVVVGRLVIVEVRIDRRGRYAIDDIGNRGRGERVVVK